jgi:hypothetical protein
MSATQKDLLKKIALSVAALLFLGACILVYLLAVKPKPVEGQKTVRLVIEYKNATFDYRDLVTEKGYLEEFLNEYNDELELGFVAEGLPLSKLIKSLKGTAQPADMSFSYTFNVKNAAQGEYTIGEEFEIDYSDDAVWYTVDNQPLKDGDTFVIRYSDWTQYPDSAFADNTAYSVGADKNIAQEKQNKKILIFFLVAGGVAVVLVGGATAYVLISGKRTPQDGKPIE